MRRQIQGSRREHAQISNALNTGNGNRTIHSTDGANFFQINFRIDKTSGECWFNHSGSNVSSFDQSGSYRISASHLPVFLLGTVTQWFVTLGTTQLPFFLV